MSSRHRQGIFSRLDGCMFGFYSDDEIRKLSAVEIKEMKGLSVLSLGEPNGLHDPRMGTLSSKQPEACQTCAGSHWSCPGHIGHIELAVQIYNPAIFKFVDAILTRKCYNCHQLLFDDTYIKVIHHKLETIDNGYLFNINSVQKQIIKLQALTKDAKDKKKNKKRNGKNENDSDSDAELAIDVVSDMQSSDDDSINSSNSQHTETEKKNAASSKINLDFLDEGIFAGTRQALLQLRWQLFQLIFKKSQPLDQCTYCQCVRMLFVRSEHCHIIQKPIGRRIKTYQQSNVKLVNINDTTQTMDVDKDITIPVSDVQKHFKALWQIESFIMTRLFAVHPFHTNNHGKHAQYDICTDYQQFFVKVIAVPPNRYRPPMFAVNRMNECAQNRQYRNILKENIAMKEIFKQITKLTTHPLLKKYTEEEKGFADKDELIEAEGLFAKYQESRKQFIQKWELLQQHYNHLTDSTKNGQLYRNSRPGTNVIEPGIRQLIEKKQGLFRMFMMGKRVNFAARSVVNPELWIKTNEIGIPLYAAKMLTYPDRVQSHNYYELRQAILNGPDIHPGANSVTNGCGQKISLTFMNLQQRTAIARTLLSNMSMNGRSHSQSQENPAANRPQIVERHLRNNDIVLVNRQPTLHKVGIMAHRVRVQHKGKVIRMHYANCNSYNADFDGDEINVHFPQSEIARSEAYNIAATDKQYVSVKDGSPLRGLMQDHVVSSVLLTKKDTFLSKDEYTQLLFSCMQTWNPAMKIRMEAPTVLKPKQLWTGKQVINTLLNAISGNLDGINMEKKTRTPANAWNGIESCYKEEGLLIVRDNYICGGILDKSQISDGQSFGLIHAIHELYGPHAASTFLTSLGQLLSTYLQSHGFSARMEDLILTEKTELQRQSIIKNSFKKSVLRCAESVGYNVDKNNKQRSYVGVINAMKRFVLSDDKNEHRLDGEMRSTLAEVTNAVIDNCYPFGSFIPFPINNFQLMILAGAKGSTVNMAQIVALLGQQELEGHRVPRMISGKTLPCFAAYDPCGRSGGFVTQRFLTGLRPQEYYFHSMAGREGLVDTACKTSRSGYLQRCLIKGLETLHVAYDNTVRDCNQNIIQFLYGEDSLDTSKASYLDVNDCRKYSFFAKNKNIIEKKVKKGMFDEHELKLIFEDRDKFLNKAFFENMPESKLHKILSADIKRADYTAMDFRNARLYMFQWHKYKKKHKIDNCDPCLNIYNPALHFGSVSESYFNRIKQFIKTFHSNTKITLSKNKRFQKEFGIKTLDFEDLMKINYAKALVESGEMVGILAAQSIGEPSTQMTLNTFHLAGFGDRNVTLGIPRMREILMTGGNNIKTPDMSFWISADIQQPMDAAIKLKKALQPLSLATLLTSRSIQGPDVVRKGAKTYKRVYTIELIIAVPKAMKDASIKGVLRCLQKQFLPTLLRLIGTNASKSAATSASKIDESQNIKDDEYNIQQMQEEKEEKSKNVDGNVEEEESDDVDADSNHSDSDLDAHSEEEKESELEDESVLFGGTDTDTVTDVGSNKMPNLVTTTDDDFSDYVADKKKKKHKKKIFRDNDKLQQELALKYNTFRSVSIVIDEPRILCSLQIELPLNHEPLLLQSLIDKVCRNHAFVRKINNIDSVHIQYDKNGGYGGSNWKIIISGFNTAVFKLVEKYVDLRSFESNSIYQIYLLYGIEAARNSIIKELLSVLGAYGLNVSFRHLSLIADAMTYFGEIRAMTRKSMSKSTSPFLRVTYETAQNFLNDSCLNKDIDNISSPSSAIVLGQVGKFGTGLFDIKQDIKQLIQIQKEQKNNRCHQQSYYSDEEEEYNEYDNDNDDDDDDGYFSKNQK